MQSTKSTPRGMAYKPPCASCLCGSGSAARVPPPVIMTTGFGDETTATKAMKSGAYDYVVKRGEFSQNLPRIISSAMERFRLKREKERAVEELKTAYEIAKAVSSTLHHQETGRWDRSGTLSMQKPGGEGRRKDGI